MEPLWVWPAFGALVVLLLTLDLCVFHRTIHTPTLRESLGWSVFWIGLAAVFNVLFWQFRVWYSDPRASEAAWEFLAGYLLEKSLSVDNLFVFAVIFRFFQVELKYQYRVLFWGILVAIFLRLGFILAGAELAHRFAWVMPIFGTFLVYTAVKLATDHEGEVDPERSWVLRVARRLFSVSREDHRERFFVRENGRHCVTPLFLVLLVIESTDVLFAVDSVPAIIGVTLDPFIMFSSNVFAILGLRALYFLLAGVLDLFRYLNYGLSAVLAFIGAKMIAEYWIGQEHRLHPLVSVVVVAVLVGASIAASMVAGWREKRGKGSGVGD